ncbi:uncharacterized protein N7483_006623 [Penicillium malachiteum]|uniref:uncharacterized protein n=1 Tax=Penicillium malachiteum TaxID=1324776 RepID=UPI002547D796|nr:uncharacterized protein N7483_006623 [Penicillium malachiteum]KAJ5725266.1 hypothetical protein N7483_006623 [Penicillium malachiteum]
MKSEEVGLISQHRQRTTRLKQSCLLIDHGSRPYNNFLEGPINTTSGSNTAKIISPNGDLIIEHTDPSSTTGKIAWQVSVTSLKENSRYFDAMLDPEKFSEGRSLAQQLQALEIKAESQPGSSFDSGNEISLPVIQFSENPVVKLCGTDILGLFMKVLCLESMNDTTNGLFQEALKIENPATIARLIQVADSFSSTDRVEHVLRLVKYQYGPKGKMSISRFDAALVDMKEERIRQIIFISKLLKDHAIFQVMTHTLLILGSRFWNNAPEGPDVDSFYWNYLSDNIEEELYYRRQCVMNTITDLQAYFMRAYGVLDDPNPRPSPAPNRMLGAAFSTSTQTTQFQCRGGMGNSSQCDTFELGQMIRFFAMRSRTVFLGSNIIDPDFNLDPLGSDDGVDFTQQGPASESIISIISTLRRYPDYQVDSYHGSCGVRRRLLPIIPCIEKYLLDAQALLGVDYRIWSSPVSRCEAEWIGGMKNLTVDIRQGIIASISSTSGKLIRFSTAAEYAKTLFTAKSRNWEA